VRHGQEGWAEVRKKKEKTEPREKRETPRRAQSTNRVLGGGPMNEPIETFNRGDKGREGRQTGRLLVQKKKRLRPAAARRRQAPALGGRGKRVGETGNWPKPQRPKARERKTSSGKKSATGKGRGKKKFTTKSAAIS